jgi:hypothetical protein
MATGYYLYGAGLIERLSPAAAAYGIGADAGRYRGDHEEPCDGVGCADAGRGQGREIRSG